MIYPKDIVTFVEQNPELQKRFPWVSSRYPVNFSSQKEVDTPLDFEVYMLEQGHQESEAIRKYLHFLAMMYDTFTHVLHYFPAVSKYKVHQDFSSTTGTAPFELMYHAMYLYYLDSYGVPGDAVECGAFKGFSACCLSWVCNYLGRRLIVADSFSGLPENDSDPYYKEGDFRGDLEEVQSNITNLGRIESVDFVCGFFADSLKDFKRPLCFLWMDVDLYESTMDVMDNLFSCLQPGGVIISHELFEQSFENDQLLRTLGPAKALYDFFNQHEIPYLAMPLDSGSGLVVPGLGTGKGVLAMSLKHSVYLREESRREIWLLKYEKQALENDIRHWQGETEKAINCFRGTYDQRIKGKVKSFLSRLGLYTKQ
jgi:hypothetical protein